MWHGVTWYDVYLYDVKWRYEWMKVIRRGVILGDETCYNMVWCGMLWCNMASHDVMLRNANVTWGDMMQCDVRWYRRYMMLHGAIWCEVIWMWGHMIWSDMIWFVVIWRDVTWCDVYWYDMKWYLMSWCNMTSRDVMWYDMTWHCETGYVVWLVSVSTWLWGWFGIYQPSCFYEFSKHPER